VTVRRRVVARVVALAVAAAVLLVLSPSVGAPPEACRRQGGASPPTDAVDASGPMLPASGVRHILSDTAQRAIVAYGGAERWLDAEATEGDVTVTGLLFHAKSRSLPPRTYIWTSLVRPYVRIDPIDRRGRVGVLDGLDVRLEDRSGRVLAERKNAPRFFPYGRRLLYWDSLDLTYFAGYAFWGYFTLPRLLLRADIAWTEVEDGILEARFPPYLPRHSEIQRFYFDRETGLLTRNDYVAEAVGSFAVAANVVLSNREWEGIPFPSRRRVTARESDGSYSQFPILVGIEVHRWCLVES
jgi:hypothetical protein